MTQTAANSTVLLQPPELIETSINRENTMRVALLKITGEHTKRSTLIHLGYEDVEENNWACPPGCMSAYKGFWTKGSNGSHRVYIWDAAGELVATCYQLPFLYTGYPFEDLLGQSGPISVYRSGIFIGDDNSWTFVLV